MTADEERGILYIPVGGAAANFWGGDRPGIGLFGNSLVAVDATTGKYKWHFQTVHHDIWDTDLPAAPNLIEIKKDGKKSSPSFELTENPDILAAVAALPQDGGRPFCVGFAAESQNLAQHAREKLVRKNVPLIVGNLGPATFGRDDNALLLIDEQGQRELPGQGGRADKLSLARELIRDLSTRL